MRHLKKIEFLLQYYLSDYSGIDELLIKYIECKYIINYPN